MNPTGLFCRRAVLALLLMSLLTAGSFLAHADEAATGLSPLVTGEQIYTHVCQGCHMARGQGAIGAGRYPALAGDPAVASAPFMAATLLKGRRNMPAFASRNQGWEYFHVLPSLSCEQIAAVINHVRTHFGNHYQNAITAAGVKALDH